MLAVRAPLPCTLAPISTHILHFFWRGCVNGAPHLHFLVLVSSGIGCLLQSSIHVGPGPRSRVQSLGAAQARAVDAGHAATPRADDGATSVIHLQAAPLAPWAANLHARLQHGNSLLRWVWFANPQEPELFDGSLHPSQSAQRG